MFLEYIFTYNLKFSAIFKHFWSRGVRAGSIIYFGNYTFFQKLHKNKMFLEFDFALEYQISLQSNQFYQFYGIRFFIQVWCHCNGTKWCRHQDSRRWFEVFFHNLHCNPLFFWNFYLNQMSPLEKTNLRYFHAHFRNNSGLKGLIILFLLKNCQRKI